MKKRTSTFILLSVGVLAPVVLHLAEVSAVTAGDVHKRTTEIEFKRPADHSAGGPLFLTPDNKQLIGISCRGKSKVGLVDFFDIPNRKLAKVMACPELVSAAAMNATGDRLFVACYDNKVRVFGSPKWELVATIDHEPRGRAADTLSVFPDGNRFLSAGGRGGARLWLNMSPPQVTRLPLPTEFLQDGDEMVEQFAISKDGKFFVIAYDVPAIAEIWAAEKPRLVGRLELNRNGEPRDAFTSVAFSPNGKIIATGYLSKEAASIGIWDAKTLKKLRDCKGAPSGLEMLAFSSDSKLVIACAHHNAPIGGLIKPSSLLFWEVDTGKLIHEIPVGREGGTRIVISADDQWLVHGGGDNVIRLLDFKKIRREIGK